VARVTKGEHEMSEGQLMPNSQCDPAAAVGTTLEFGSAGRGSAAPPPPAEDAHVQPLSEPLFPADPAPARRLTVVGGAEVVPSTPARTSVATAVPPETGAVPGSLGKPCSCGHGKQAHQHYRAGSDCALCGCGRYSRPLLARLFSR
jgi:hypothetical protein